ncbi:hypothetical protein, partial [Waltera acetigignens]|uniref:hypothetical protein n=1 Tax=Waltera acetigignens TaxID=2981769 RepID=UPI0021D17535
SRSNQLPFLEKVEKLRHSLGRPSRSDFVHFQFVVLKIQLNNPSKNRCYMEANKPCNSGFSLPFFPLADRRSHFL